MSCIALFAIAVTSASAVPAAPLTVSAGYLGDFATHPGAFLGLETPLWSGGFQEVTGGARLAAYHHVRHHTGVLARAELTYRAIAPFGLYGEVLAGVGAHHRLLAGPVFTGGPEPGFDLGQTTVMPGLGLGAGWAMDLGGGWPDRLFLRVDGFARAPANGGWLPSLAVSSGVAWTFGAS